MTENLARAIESLAPDNPGCRVSVVLLSESGETAFSFREEETHYAARLMKVRVSRAGEPRRHRGMRDTLHRQQYGDMVAASLPPETPSIGKDGVASGALHDVRAFATGAGCWTLAVCTCGPVNDLGARTRLVGAVASAVAEGIAA